MQNNKITFIGAGNMAKAIIGGLIQNGYNKDLISAADKSVENLQLLQTELGIQTYEDNCQAIAAADIIVLAIKPQHMKTVCKELQDSLANSKAVIISIAAGITISMLENNLSPTLSIVRCMPNTPALVQCGASGLYANQQCNEQQKLATEELLSAIGIISWVEQENLIDAVTAVSGSGPAYFFLVMEAMQEAGVTLGLPAETAMQLTIQTALGAAKMAQASDVDAAELRKRVTSPGGTTAAALTVLEEQGLRESFAKALKAADDRSKSLAKEME